MRADSARACRYATERGIPPLIFEEPAVADKSPRQTSSKKSSKTLKQKRAEKKAATNTREHPSAIPSRRPGN